MKTVSPIDGSVVAEIQPATDRDIDAALAIAARAQREWKRVPLPERVAICDRMVNWMVARADEIGTELTRQMGRPVSQTPFEIRRGFQERARYMTAVAADALADLDVGAKPGFRRFIRHEPLGVVLVLAPWNYPYLTSVNAVVPALVAGNSVILKVSQQTPLVASRYAEAFAEAGLPSGVFQYVHTDHDAVLRMIDDPRVAFVSFTGSVEGGRAVQQAAVRRFIGSNLELGGKDPAYVRADAPLAATIENLVDRAYFNAGQSCCAVERIYVHHDVHQEFLDGFVTLTRHYKLGNPLLPETTLGPMVRANAAESVREQIREAVAQGARSLIDPRDFPAVGGRIQGPGSYKGSSVHVGTPLISPIVTGRWRRCGRHRLGHKAPRVQRGTEKPAARWQASPGAVCIRRAARWSQSAGFRSHGSCASIPSR